MVLGSGEEWKDEFLKDFRVVVEVVGKPLEIVDYGFRIKEGLSEDENKMLKSWQKY